MSKIKPDIEDFINDVVDENSREVFRRLVNYFAEQNQFQDFKHLEIVTTQAETNLRIRHGLTFRPKDILRTKLVGAGALTFNHDKFDKDFLDITTTGALRFRGYVGTFIRDTSVVDDTQTESV